MRLIISLMLAVVFFSCNNEKEPDVSNIKIELKTSRFEQDLFSLDTNNLAPQLDQLISKYPSFGENFLSLVLNVDPRWPADTAIIYVKGFISAYRNLYDTSTKVFSSFKPYENEIKKGLQFMNHYFPAYKTPKKIITYIGPLDGFGDILTEDALVVGLHHHLGKDFSMYKQSIVQEVYAGYISRRFEPAYIAINAMKNMVLDMYPEKNEDASLVNQMVEKGKRLYVLNRLLPAKDEYMLIGYTKEQLAACYKNEARIWNLFTQNELLQTIDNNVIKNYIGEGPKTQELGEDSPGNIGSFLGWQIVKKYMSKNKDLKLNQLINTPAETIFSTAKYKP
ncbi:MAG: hypothetical protein KBF74_03970 [Ferruginibacter sp.]|nr:hypothetical protein [Ferruginibacter sp.]